MECRVFRNTMLWLAVLSLATFNTFAQNDNPKKLSLALKAYYDPDKGAVLLRWAPKDYLTWNTCNTQGGYRLDRYTLAYKTAKFGANEIELSKVTLAEDYVPAKEDEFESYADGDDAYGIVAGCIYGDSLDVIDPANTTLLQVYNIEQERESRFSFSILACDQNFNLAGMAALGFVDSTNIGLDYTYLYVVSPMYQDTNLIIEKGYATIWPDQQQQTLPQPLNVKAIPGDHVVTIRWDRSKTLSGEEYTGYFIERSTDGESWEPVNILPFISLVENGKESESMAFLDSLPDNDNTYYYRVVGKTPFAMFGPPSEMVEAKGIPGPLIHAPSILSVEEVAAGTLKVLWQMQAGEDQHVGQYEVFRAETIEGPYDSLGTVPPTQGTFTDYAPLASNYYIVRAKETRGHRISSFPMLGQINDMTPPAAPLGLQVTCNRTGLVQLHWNPNTEPDLAGYTVYTSNDNLADSIFIQVSPSVSPDTSFLYEISLETLSEDLYFAVRAVDKRDNYSPMSVHCRVLRPDLVPPDAPVISAVRPRPVAIEFDWIPSSSTDVVRYEVQKRQEQSPSWVTLFTYTPDTLARTVLDSLSYLVPASRRVWYQYRILAYDEANNVSSSGMVRAKPVETGLREPIQNLTATWNPTAGGTDKGAVSIEWEYSEDVDLVGFQLYRAIDNSLMRPYEFLGLHDAVHGLASAHTYACGWEDYDLDFKALPARTSFIRPPATFLGNNTISVQPGAVNQPTLNQPPGSPQPVTLHYRLVAVFADGALSPPSQIVSVQVL